MKCHIMHWLITYRIKVKAAFHTLLLQLIVHYICTVQTWNLLDGNSDDFVQARVQILLNLFLSDYGAFNDRLLLTNLVISCLPMLLVKLFADEADLTVFALELACFGWLLGDYIVSCISRLRWPRCHFPWFFWFLFFLLCCVLRGCCCGTILNTGCWSNSLFLNTRCLGNRSINVVFRWL